MTNIQTKFNLGDYVYTINSFSQQHIVACPACDGEGKIKLLDNKSYSCPSCYGRSVIKHDPVKWNVSLTSSGKIGNIRLELYDEGYNYENEIKYMLDSTGIGSGTLWKEEDLFLTREEAEAECERRNNNES